MDMPEEQLAQEVDNLWNRQTPQIRIFVSDGLKNKLRLRLENSEEKLKIINEISNCIKTNSPTETWQLHGDKIIQLGHSRIEFLNILYNLLIAQERATAAINRSSRQPPPPPVITSTRGGKRKRNKKSKRNKNKSKKNKSKKNKSRRK